MENERERETERSDGRLFSPSDFVVGSVGACVGNGVVCPFPPPQRSMDITDPADGMALVGSVSGESGADRIQFGFCLMGRVSAEYWCGCEGVRERGRKHERKLLRAEAGVCVGVCGEIASGKASETRTWRSLSLSPFQAAAGKAVGIGVGVGTARGLLL